MNIIAEIPQQLKRCRFVKLLPKSKVPCEKDWQNNPLSNDVILPWIAEGNNYGVACGVDNLLVIDADTQEFREQLSFLPSTFTVETPTGGVHKYLICSNWNGGYQIEKDGKPQGECRYKNKQVVGPGSEHPNGGIYKVISDAPIAELTSEEIIPLLGDFQLKSSHEKIPLQVVDIPQGKQDDTLFRFACSLKEKGFTPTMVESALRESIKTLKQDPQNPFTDRDISRWINQAFSYPDKENHHQEEIISSEFVTPVALTEVKLAFKKWLYLEDDRVIDVVCGSILANRYGSDPVWLFLVGGPGATKTEILRNLTTDEFYSTSSLTAHSLISGLTIKDKGKKTDPSIMQYLDGKILTIKDFTSVLTGDRHDRDEIFGQLRDAYDGYCEKIFGSEAGKRSYKAKFGLLAAVTGAIDSYSSVNSSLGERYLKFRVDPESRMGSIKQASKNRGKEKEMRAELQEAMKGFLSQQYNSVVTINDEMLNKLQNLAHLISWVRSGVSRDGYKRTVDFIPAPEVGTRLVKQLESLACGIASARGKATIDAEEYDLIIKISKDSLPSKLASVVDVLYQETESQPTSYFGQKLKLGTGTVKETLEDLYVLGILDREAEMANKNDEKVMVYKWKLKESEKEENDVRKLIDSTGLFRKQTAEVPLWEE